MNAPFPAAETPATELPPLNLLIAAPRGFCAGVDRAIEIVEKALERVQGGAIQAAGNGGEQHGVSP